jgi:hypothetical protein
MADPLPRRLGVALAVTAAASALAAAPALATEGPHAPPPTSFPTKVGPVTFPPVPAVPLRPARVVRHARIVPRRVRHGRRARLNIALRTPSRLLVVVTRGANGHRIRAYDLAAAGSRVSLRLPVRSHGRALRPGRYRVTIVAVDARGTRARPVVRTMVVRRRAHR